MGGGKLFPSILAWDISSLFDFYVLPIWKHFRLFYIFMFRNNKLKLILTMIDLLDSLPYKFLNKTFIAILLRITTIHWTGFIWI